MLDDMKKKKTLLQKARAVRPRHFGPPPKPPSAQELQLAIAYVTGRIRISDVNFALHGRPTSSGSSGYILARALRHAYSLGKLKI